ncbi:TonB-dependent receptor [Thalassotalea hakodatensis]|uniref:TonB-dependent receptor n=1 Tax=Thalassotalea hakodatensis TaxID=3030492 RepID=UPI0025740F0F|nr:TonB-dependent receptor [Thalassotalea hakodatensis]
MHSNKFKKSYLACCLAISASQVGLVHAASSEESSGAEDNVEVITVKGVRGSIVRSLNNKYNDSNVSDSISSEDLGKFPDMNLSESLQRIPGVTINRNQNGEGSQINVRGLGPQFTRVEINGMTAPGGGSAGRLGTNGGGRGFSFELLPSELFSNATVTKSSDASQSEGGLAGLVTLETPQPFQHRGLKFSSSLQGNYSDTTDSIDPRAFVTVSNNIDDKFGFSIGLFHSKSEFRSDGAENGVWRPLSVIDPDVDPNSPMGSALVANGTRLYTFLEDRENTAGTLALQYSPSDELAFTFNSIYAELTNEKAAHRNDIPLEHLGVKALQDSLVIENGVIVEGSFDNVQHRVGPRITDIDDTFFQTSLTATWKPNDYWEITPYIGASSREANRKQSLLSFKLNNETGGNVPGILSYKVRGDYVDFNSTLTDFSSNPEDFSLNVLIFRPSEDDAKEVTSKIDFTRFFDHEFMNKVDFGLRYTVQDKEVVEQDYRIGREAGWNPNMGPSLADSMIMLDYDVDGADPSFTHKMFSVDPNGFQDVWFQGGNVSPTGSSLVPGTSVQNRASSAALNSYQVEEKTLNAYVKADFDWEELTANVGLRYVKTTQNIDGFTTALGGIDPIAFESDYSEVLPSASLRYELSEGVLLRAAYSKTLTRPNLPDLAPSERIFAPDVNSATGQRGNPELKPFTSDNLDLSIEWYFSDEALLAANVFRKDLDGLIDTTTFTANRDFVTQLSPEVFNGDVFFTQPSNGASASIKGFELSYQQPFSFAPEGILQNFGFLANYTKTSSDADFGIENDVRSAGLPGLSPTSFNASLYYDDGTLDAKLSYAWRERYLAQTSDDFGEPRFMDDYGQLDFSANYSVNDNLQVQFQVLNLTDENMVAKTFVHKTGYLPYGVTDLSRRVLLGVRYSF